MIRSIFSSSIGGSFTKRAKTDCAGDGVVDVAAFDLEFVQHFAQRRCELAVTHRFAAGVRQNFAQPILPQDQTAVWLRLKFGEPDRLRTEIKRNDASGGGH